ncbi:uncharacterized protein EAE97_008548 [Botrytis byssoidea]|uniref:Uncharacterized protein n=1 Tax=Botrytis byssoidea TaxID=139641 RepID=A0A9P5I9S7_9HELO|nr:uncharacterized protein EAE97_008548 [Botrytis byssoidea]KAF7934188.1 hypothetical protein EAE97_008548 [Botrytis byssoidea]
MTATRIVVYSCTHELPDTQAYIERAQATPYQYRHPIVNRLRRAFTLNEFIRRPSMDLCPVCQAKNRQRSRPAQQAQPSPRPRGQTLQDRPHPVHAPQVRLPAPARDSPDSAGSQPQVPQPWNMAEGPPDLPVLLPPRHPVTPSPQANAQLSNMAEGPPDLPVLQFPSTTTSQPQTDAQPWNLPGSYTGLPGTDVLTRGWDAMRRRGAGQRNLAGQELQRSVTDGPRRSSPSPPSPPPKDHGVHPRVNAWVRQQTSETLKKHHDRITQPLEFQSSESRPSSLLILIPDPLTLTPSTTRSEDEVSRLGLRGR